MLILPPKVNDRKHRDYLTTLFGYEDIRVFDTMPLPVCPLEKSARLAEFPFADFGYCASKKEYYFGFKLGLSILPVGLPDVIEILPARPHDVNYLEELVDSGGVIYLGDKGFICDPRVSMLEKRDEKLVITPNRDNYQEAGNTDLENMLLWFWRNKIEAVFFHPDSHAYKENRCQDNEWTYQESLRHCSCLQRWNLYQRRPRSLSFGGCTARIITHNHVFSNTSLSYLSLASQILLTFKL